MTAPIDLEHLNKYVFGDEALLREILGIFREQIATLANRMAPDASDDDWRLAAHTLKGAARGVGAWALGDAAERAEALGADAGPDVRAVLLQEVIDLGGRAVDHANTLIERAA